MNGWWWREIADLVLPVDCAGCGRPRRGGWCEACRARLSGPGAVRPVRPRPVPPGLPPVWAAGPYRDELRAALLAHKERGALRLAAPLGDALAAAVLAACGSHCVPAYGPPARVGDVAPVRTDGGAASRVAGVGIPPGRGRSGGAMAGGGALVAGGGAPGGGRAGAGERIPVVSLVPVPSSRAATAARGHDPAKRMACRAARTLRRAGPVVRVVPLLRQCRAVDDQAGLTAAERLANLAGALTVVRGGERLLADGPVVVVDDLLTTGASLAEAARAVRAAGGTVLGAAVVAGPPGSYDAAPVADVRGRC